MNFGNTPSSINEHSGIDKIVPVSFTMTRSGSYQPQQRRSWEVLATAHTMNRITSTLERLGSTSINPGVIGSLGGMLSLGAQTQGEVAIPNSWAQSRGIFMLMLDFYMRDANVVRYCIQGFTETPEFSEQHVDPNLVFYVNNVLSFMTRTQRVSGVDGTSILMNANFQPLQNFDSLGSGMMGGLSGGSFGGISRAAAENTLIRPQDIMANAANGALIVDGVQTVEDHSMKMGGPILKSSVRANSIASTMATRVLNTFNQAHASMRDSYDVSAGDIAENAYNAVLEQEAEMDLFLRQISAQEQGGAKASFKWSRLTALVPGVNDSTVKKIFLNPGGAYRMSQQQDSMTFGKKSLSAIAAANLQVSLPAMHVECLLHTVNFTATSLGSQRTAVFSNHSGQCFNPQQSVQQWNVFASRFQTEIVPAIRGPHNYPFDMLIQSQFNGEFHIKISVAEEEPVVLVAPAFCDALSNPTITANEAHAKQLSMEMITACEVVSDQLLLNQERKTRGSLSAIDKRSIDSSQFRQGDVIGMGGFGPKPAPANPGMNPATLEQGQMNVNVGAPKGGLLGAFK